MAPMVCCTSCSFSASRGSVSGVKLVFSMTSKRNSPRFDILGSIGQNSRISWLAPHSWATARSSISPKLLRTPWFATVLSFDSAGNSRFCRTSPVTSDQSISSGTCGGTRRLPRMGGQPAPGEGTAAAQLLRYDRRPDRHTVDDRRHVGRLRARIQPHLVQARPGGRGAPVLPRLLRRGREARRFLARGPRQENPRQPRLPARITRSP